MSPLNLTNKNLITTLIACTAVTQILPQSSLAGQAQSRPARPTAASSATSATSDSSTTSAAAAPVSPSSKNPKIIPLKMTEDEAEFKEKSNVLNKITSAAIHVLGITKEEAFDLAERIAADSNSSSLKTSFSEILQRIKTLSEHYEKTDLKHTFTRITADQDINIAADRSILFTKSAQLMQDLDTFDVKYKELSNTLNETVKKIKEQYPNYSFLNKDTNSPLLTQDITAENIDKYADFELNYNSAENKSINPELLMNAKNLILKGISLKHERALAKKQAANSILQNAETSATTLTSDQYKNFEEIVKLLSKDPRKEHTPSEIFQYALTVALDSHRLSCSQFMNNYDFHCKDLTTSTKQAAEFALEALNRVKRILSPQAHCGHKASKDEAKPEKSKQSPAAQATSAVPSFTAQNNKTKEEEKHHPGAPKSSPSYKDSKDEAKELKDHNPSLSSTSSSTSTFSKPNERSKVTVMDALSDWESDDELTDSGNLTDSIAFKYERQTSSPTTNGDYEVLTHSSVKNNEHKMARGNK